jgi:CubicO group peptidase (beta-lactamase class C family)
MKHLSKARFLVLLIWMSGLSVAGAQAITSAQIDALTERALKEFDVPGIAVAVIKDGKVVHSKGYGLRSLKTMQKVDENTLFGIASNSKAFTAATLAMLIDEGKLKWDDKVIDYIPEFRMYNSYVTEEFTIRDLLTHRSGLGLGAGDLMFWPDSSDFTIKDIIHNLRYLKPVSGFRTKYDYDNLLYMVAGEVVARISGKPWEQFVQERIMTPLQMNNSAGNWYSLKNRDNVVDAHCAVNGKIQVIKRDMNTNLSPAGGIYSSIADLSKWVIMQLNGGKYGDGKQLFSEAMQKDMWSPQTILPVNTTPPYNVHFSAYGLGWGLADVKGYKQVSHTGGLPGMVTLVTLIPELKLGIIVLTNQQVGAAFSSIGNTIKDSYLGIPPTDRIKAGKDAITANEANANKITSKIWTDIEAAQKSSVAKADPLLYTGTYRDDWFGEILISQKNNGMWFQSKRSPRLRGTVLPYKGNTFIVKWADRSFDADAWLTFRMDADGKAEGFKMKAISPLTDFSFDFHDLDPKRVDSK